VTASSYITYVLNDVNPVKSQKEKENFHVLVRCVDAQRPNVAKMAALKRSIS